MLSAASERVLAVFDRRLMPSVPSCPGWGGNTDRLLPRSFTIARCVGEHPHNHRTWAVRYNSASACKKVRARVTPSIIHRHPAKTQGRVTNAHVLLATCPLVASCSPSAIPASLHARRLFPAIFPTTTPDFVQARVRDSRNQSLASTTINPALEPSPLFLFRSPRRPPS